MSPPQMPSATPPQMAPMSYTAPNQSWGSPAAAPRPPAQMPPLSSTPSQPSISNRIIGGIISIVVIVAVWLIYGAITRNF
jgi:hypothetical protein